LRVLIKGSIFFSDWYNKIEKNKQATNNHRPGKLIAKFQIKQWFQIKQHPWL